MNELLFSFNILFDIEFGLYKLIMDEYGEEYFQFKLKDNDYLKTIIMYRDNPNPLSKIATDKTKDDIEKLLNEFIKTEYDKILDNIIFTDLIIYVESLKNTNRYVPIILCRNQKEEQLCIKHNLKTLLYEENINWKEISDRFGSLYFRYFEEADLLELEGKNIYFSNTIYNIINKDKLLSINNIIRFIDLYRL